VGEKRLREKTKEDYDTSHKKGEEKKCVVRWRSPLGGGEVVVVEVCTDRLLAKLVKLALDR